MIRSTKWMLAAALVAATGCAGAPISEDGISEDGISEDERAVVATVQEFFDVMAARDVTRATQLVVPEGGFVSVRQQDGRPALGSFTNADWLGQLAGSTDNVLEAFDGAPEVRVSGDVAMVWAPYTFDVNGERSHTGVDVFALVRTAEGWKLAGGAYSVVRDATAR